MQLIHCATTNPGKVREFGLIASHFGAGRLEVTAVPGLNSIPAPAETGDTFQANASLKAAYYSRFAEGFVFADDSGLEVDALGGAPGIYSARYGGPGATDAENNQRLLAELAGVLDRSARFVCAIAVAQGGKPVVVFEDFVAGAITLEPRGPNGFGYDPLFYYEPFGCTFGEAPAEQKLLVSHRGRAMEKMIRWLAEGGRVPEY